MGLEITFADHPVRKQAFLDLKIWIFPSHHIEIFSEGLTYDFRQKLQISSSFLCAQNEL